MTENIQTTLEQALEDTESGDESGITEELLLDAVDQYFGETDDLDEQVETLNALRERLHDNSPFNEPVENIRWVRQSNVEGNEYNPNQVAQPEMELLHKSIEKDGFTQPIVTYHMGGGEFEVVDGFHRMLIGKERTDIRERLNGYLPVSVIDKDLSDRIASTICHNRASGSHEIEGMSNVVASLYQGGWDDQRICNELGMEMDEVIRLKQESGLKAVFSDHEFSESWTEYQDRHGTDQEDNIDE